MAILEARVHRRPVLVSDSGLLAEVDALVRIHPDLASGAARQEGSRA